MHRSPRVRFEEHPHEDDQEDDAPKDGHEFKSEKFWDSIAESRAKIKCLKQEIRDERQVIADQFERIRDYFVEVESDDE